MGHSLLIISLSVVLISVFADGDIECFTNIRPDKHPTERNSQCQISYGIRKDENECDILDGVPELTAVGNKPSEKVLQNKGSDTVILDRCRFIGTDKLVCNCETPYCNKNFHSLWPDFLKTKFNTTDKCKAAWSSSGYALIEQFKNTTNPKTDKPLPVPPTELYIQCSATTGPETTVKADYCALEYEPIPGTCYVYGPVTRRGIIDPPEGDICINTKIIRVTCTTDNCTDDIEIIRKQVEDGTPVTGGRFNEECKSQILVSIGKAFPTQEGSTTEATDF